MPEKFEKLGAVKTLRRRSVEGKIFPMSTKSVWVLCYRGPFALRMRLKMRAHRKEVLAELTRLSL